MPGLSLLSPIDAAGSETLTPTLPCLSKSLHASKSYLELFRGCSYSFQGASNYMFIAVTFPTLSSMNTVVGNNSPQESSRFFHNYSHRNYVIQFLPLLT